jgi:hypothetical protein
MTDVTELRIRRAALRDTEVVRHARPALEAGQIRVAIDRMGLTANNVSYAMSGDVIGYWKFFPVSPDAQAEWGLVPGWAMGDVIESESDAIAVGERLYGFFPMASEVVLAPGHTVADFFIDAAAHRQELPALYNQYRRVQGEPEALRAMEDERCLLFPLFITSWVLADYLRLGEFFGAQQVVIGSVSSKTGLGLAKILHDDPEVSLKVVGMTSPGNAAFVDSLGCCDQIIHYGDEDALDASLPTAWVDMSGDGPLTDRLHHLLGEQMVESCIVGATHWEGERSRSADLPGAKPAFFFAPGHIARRDAEWGTGETWRRASLAGADIARSIQGQLVIERISGADEVARVWRELLDNRVSPGRGLMISIPAAADRLDPEGG